MATKVKRKRIVKPVKLVKPTDPVKPDIQVKDELISVPVASDVLSSCVGCYFYDEPNKRCKEKENRDCTGVIFVKK